MKGFDTHFGLLHRGYKQVVFKRGCKARNHPTPHADFPAGIVCFDSLQPQLHLYPSSPSCIPTPPFRFYLLASYIQIPFYWDLSRLLSLFIWKIVEYSPPFCNVAHLWQRIGAISDLLLFFPDSYISMSLLGLSLPPQRIWSSEDQVLERQRAPAAPTSPHPSLYPSISPHSSFSLHSMLVLT